MAAINEATRIYLDLTHTGRHVTGIERIAIEQFEKVTFAGAALTPVRAPGLLSMILKQQFLLPILALTRPRAQFIFPGFPPSPFFALIRDRVTFYVHDTFLITRVQDLSFKAKLYMAPQFRFAVRHLRRFLVNSEKTKSDLLAVASPGAEIGLYRPHVPNVFDLSPSPSGEYDATLRLVSMGTIEPRKNYAAAAAIVDELRNAGHPGAELHIIGRPGWGAECARVANHGGVIVHGYLDAGGVKRVVESADVYLCTSHDEGLGLPLIEAQYAGLPIIAPDQRVFREVLGDSGTFIDPARPETAAAAITALIAMPGWRERARVSAAANIARWNAAALSDLKKITGLFAPRSSPSRAAAAAAPRAP